MTGRNETSAQRWATRTIEGVTYTFDHLRPFDLRLTRPAKGAFAALDIAIHVVFDCHVVTEAVEERVGDPAAYWFDSANNFRRFDRDRYEWSRCLPQMINGLVLVNGGTKCYIAKSRNYMIWKPAGTDLNGPHYQAYFNIYRRGGEARLMMYIQTAYVKGQPYKDQREDEKPFATVCAELLGLVSKPAKGPRNKAKKR